MPGARKPALNFHLDPKSGVPFYKQIILQVELAIADGRLTHNDQLPTVRSMAVDLNLNPNTVARAYNEMEIRGIVNTQQGTGTFIAQTKIELSDIEREQFLEGLIQPFAAKALSYGFNYNEVCQALKAFMNPSGTKPGKEPT